MTPRKPAHSTTPGLARSGTWLHRQVYLVLRDRLMAGAFQPGEALPAEPALCAQFGVSRITLRRAVADLGRDGLLERIQGKGTFVTAPPARPSGSARGHGYVDDVRRLSADTTVKVLEFGHVPAPGRIAAWLKVAAGERVHRSVRLRLRQGKAVVLLTAWVPAPAGDTITRADLSRYALNELLAKQGVRFGRLMQEVGAGLADPLQAQRLHVDVGAALLLVDRLVHDHLGVPVEYVSMALSSTRSRMVFDTPAELVDQISSGRFIHA